MSNLEKRLKEIKERMEKATEGPWSNETVYLDFNMPYVHSVFIGKDSEPIQVYDGGKTNCRGQNPTDNKKCEKTAYDASFIAHSRSDIEFLVKALEILIDGIGKTFEDDREAAYYKVEELSK